MLYSHLLFGGLMYRLALLLSLFTALCIAEQSNANTAVIYPDSLVDVFPLSIGNEWIYHYDYEFRDINGFYDYLSDTGTVSLRVFDKVVTADSIRWIVQQRGSHWVSYNRAPFYGPETRVDTFEIVEFNSSNHRLYRTGDRSDISVSVLPFLPNLVDSAMIYRYAKVDSAGYKSFMSSESPGGKSFFFRFKQAVGLETVGMSDGCLCVPWYWTSHSLCSSSLTGINTPREGLFTQSYFLLQNFPNPFNPSTTISFSLPNQSYVTLNLYDILGREIATLVRGRKGGGSYSVEWNANGHPSGVYLLKIDATSISDGRRFTDVKKMVLVR
jgi:hypothetical protein